MTSQVMAAARRIGRMAGMKTISATAASSRPEARGPGARDSFGVHLRHWRQRRRLSQFDLAEEAAISTRHLSYVETGRAAPSREMVLRLAERLAVPLRERNALLVAAGFAPMYQQRGLDDPALAAARQAVAMVLKAQEPYPALAVDRQWNMVAANAVVPRLLEGVAATLLAPPVNVLRLALHPEGLAPRIHNLGQWRAHLLERLEQQIAATGDAALQALHAELAAYPPPPGRKDEVEGGRGHAEALSAQSIVVPLQLATGAGLLNLISTTTVFGSPVDITLQELAVESFFPADAATAIALVALAA